MPIFGGTPADRPRPVSAGGWLRAVIDRTIAASSLVSTAPVLDMRTFGWTALLRDRWRAIRDEAMRIVPPAQGAVRSVALWEHGDRVVETLVRCPVTAAAIAAIPGLDGACFAILAPGAHVPARRGVSKALVTCHLGLVVPRDGDVRMRVGDRYLRWAEGETLVFDDSCAHESWNDAAAMRMVLEVRFRRPLRQPGRWLADAVLKAARRG
ncbi:aspartyl/asparaginyl beta-hydroxylase domain-containing protein [Sphingomonas sp. FARSPH]|nr:aspartyl/asparaginyl beta-hydroxylase domain-containing protein [Sphingomonas sp. FARSPH]